MRNSGGSATRRKISSGIACLAAYIHLVALYVSRAAPASKQVIQTDVLLYSGSFALSKESPIAQRPSTSGRVFIVSRHNSKHPSPILLVGDRRPFVRQCGWRMSAASANCGAQSSGAVGRKTLLSTKRALAMSPVSQPACISAVRTVH